MRISSIITWSAACLLLGSSVTTLAHALDRDEKDPKKIAAVADDPPTWDQSISQVKMTIKDSGGVRERSMTIRRKRYGETQKIRIAIEAPADLRNTGFLSIDHHARDQRDEQWLYLPALHKVSRIPDSGRSDAFIGSDFSFADMMRQDPEDYDVKLVEASAMVGDEECWLIEGTPRSKEVQEKTGYTKRQTWVSKSKQVVIQAKMWSAEAGKVKYLKATDFRQIDGAWTPHRVQMRTVKGTATTSETLIQIVTLSNKATEVSDGDFTKQRLEGGV